MALIGASNSLGGLAGSNAIARLLVVISGDSSQLTRAIGQAQGTMTGFQQNAQTIGNALTRTLTLPALAISGAAVKMAADYGQALGRIAGLTPILDETGKSLEQVSDELLALASDPQVIAGPTAIADAFYFAGSAGLSAAEAMDVVKLSSQGASIGMGEAERIAVVLIAALNNYRTEGLGAAQAMDALAVAIREGTAEPDEMAVALGRLLPIAKQAGVAFEEVVAGVAGLTNLGVPTRVATTALRALFSQLLAPTIAATDKLKEFGITADQLRYKLQQGPIEAFQLLIDSTNGNADAIRTLIPQIRGLTAFYGLTDRQMAEYRDTIEKTTNSQGAFQRAVDAVSAQPLFKFQKGLQSLQVAAIDLGQNLFPFFERLAGMLKDLGQDFGNLPEPVQTFIAALLLSAAAIGPMFKLFGVLTEVTDATGRLYDAGLKVQPTMKAWATGFITAGVAATIAFQAFNALGDGSTSLITIATSLVASFVAVRIALKGLELAALSGRLGAGRLSEVLVSLGGRATPIAAGIGLIATAFFLLKGRAEEASRRVQQLGTTLTESANSGELFAQAINKIEDEKLRNVVREAARAADVLQRPVGEGFVGAIDAIGDELSGLFDTMAQSDNLNQFFIGLEGGTTQFKALSSAVADAVANGENFDKVLEQAGSSGEEFVNVLEGIAGRGGNTFEQGAARTIVNELLPAYIRLGEAMRDYERDQRAAIAVQSASEESIQEMANRHNVSVDFMRKKLDEFGVSAVGMSEKTEESFAKAAFGVDKSGNLISGRMQEMKEAALEAGSALEDAMAGSISIFEKVDAASKKPLETFIQRMERWRDVSLQMTEDVINLQNRGVPQSLIEKLAAEGPGMLSKFAGATDKELRRIVTAYQIHLEAIDAQILAEGAHQEQKGRGMVRGFAAAILQSKSLPFGAAKQIVKAVSNAINSGSLEEEAYGLVQSFVKGLDQMKVLSPKEAAAATQALVNELKKPRNYDQQGRLIVTRVAQGISAASGVPVDRINLLLGNVINTMASKGAKFNQQGFQAVQAFTAGIANAQNAAYNAGADLMRQVAQGVRDYVELAYTAAREAGAGITSNLRTELQGSPKFASYYMGIDYAKQFAEGVQKAGGFDTKVAHERVASPVLRVPTAAYNARRNRHDDARKLQVGVKLDRRHFSRQMAIDSTYRGW